MRRIARAASVALVAACLALAAASGAAATPIADSVADFSGTQGQGGWYYGFYGAPPASSSFTKMTFDPLAVGGLDTTVSRPTWFELDGTYWTQLWSYGGHPESVVTSAGRVAVDQWAVRRWVSPFAGRIEISGVLAKFDPRCGDGVIGHILVDGAEVWSQPIGFGDSIGVSYRVDAAVQAGSTVDLAIDPGGNDWCDSTRFTATIANVTPPPSIAYTVSPPAPDGNDGWYRSDVALAWQVSGATSTTGCVDRSITSDQPATGYSCAASNSGGTTGPTTVTIKRDATPPTVSYSGNAGAYTVDQSVDIACAAADNLSGVVADTCADVVAPAWSLGLGSHSYAATATDDAGNTGSGSATFTVEVTPSSLCTLTARFAEGSARYQLLPAWLRSPANAWLATACRKLDALVGALTPRQKVEFVAAYERSVDLLSFGDFLTSDQASVLKTVAAALAH